MHDATALIFIVAVVVVVIVVVVVVVVVAVVVIVVVVVVHDVHHDIVGHRVILHSDRRAEETISYSVSVVCFTVGHIQLKLQFLERHAAKFTRWYYMVKKRRLG